MTDLIEKLKQADVLNEELFRQVVYAAGATGGSLYRRLVKLVRAEAWASAALALIEAKFRGQWRRSTYDPDCKMPYTFTISDRRPYGGYENFTGQHKTSEPAAALIALLEALSAKEKG